MSTDDLMPQSYDEWHHCITVKCNLKLTLGFINERINALQDVNDFKTRQFVQLYGEQYHQQVVAWFHRAQEKVEN